MLWRRFGKSLRVLSVATAALIAAPALATQSVAATTTTTASCTDGGGVIWRTKVEWGGEYTSSTGKRQLAVDYAGWTTAANTMGTDAVVSSYSGPTLTSSSTYTTSFDYKQGSAYDSRDPQNPESGGAKITIAVGKDNDGKPKCTTTHLQPGTTTSSTGWRLTWADEFNGTNVDTSKWSVRNNWTPAQDFSVTKSANASEANGVLSMKTGRLGSPVYTSDGRKRLMSTVYMDTDKKFSQRYGRWEARMNLGMNRGTSSGMWPAFWLRDDAGGRGEIDIMEALGSPHTRSSAEPYGSFGATLHRDTSHHSKERWRSEPRKLPDGSDIGVGWHTFAFEWSSTEMRFYADNYLLNTVKASSLFWYQEAFSNRYSIRLCVQWGDPWAMPSLAGSGDMATPATTQVDYVRVYTR